MVITVKITECHIATGLRRSSSCCPVALAVKSLLKQECFVSVHSKSVGFYDTVSQPVVSVLPGQAHEFILAFDENMEVEPFSFDLEIPDNMIKAA